MKSEKKSYWQQVKLLFKKMLTANDSPHKLAMGFAIGVFWGIMPTFGIAILFSLPTAVILKANKVTAILGTFVSNPLTTLLFYPFNIRIGSFILKIPPFPFSWDIFKIENLWNMGKSLLVGGVISAIVTAFISYAFVLMVIFIVKKSRSSHFQSSRKSGER